MNVTETNGGPGGEAQTGSNRGQKPVFPTAGDSLPSISSLGGGVSAAGAGEKFTVNPANGTGSWTIPIPTTAGRQGFGPTISLTYDSESGNGLFGVGWSLSIPAITRKTSKGIPKYNDAEDSDVFLLNGAEDLVPLFMKTESGEIEVDKTTSVPIIKTELRNGYTISRYNPRIDTSFQRIERWTKNENPGKGDIHWRILSSDNVTSVYGETENSRVSGPVLSGQRTFSWLLAEQYDSKGNAIVYKYKAEDSVGVQTSQAHEQNRTEIGRSTNRYLSLIHYGNRTPNRDAGWSAASALEISQRDWMFTVAFDYGEFDRHRPTLKDTHPWTCRKDAFSTYRPGFELRTYRRCQRILMFHHFPADLGIMDYPVTSTDLGYDESSTLSYLVSIQRTGYLESSQGVSTKQLPPLTFGYTRFPTDEALTELRVSQAEAPDLHNLPREYGGMRHQWVDLDGEGLPGVLVAHDGGWLYQRNLSGWGNATEDGEIHISPSFGPVEAVYSVPSLLPSNTKGVYLTDIQRDGALDVVCMARPNWGFFARNADTALGWSSFRSFASHPSVSRGETVSLVDLTGDGLPDILIAQECAFVWYPSLGELGYGPPCRGSSFAGDEDIAGLLFRDVDQSIHLADISGDGMTDLVRIRNGDICYWPNLGNGRFGPRVNIDNSPWFDKTAMFDPERLLLADIDGSGTCDIIYLSANSIDVYINEAGNSFSNAKHLAVAPVDKYCTVEPVDLFGNGTTCLVWRTRLPGAAEMTMNYIDFTNGHKPHLLVSQTNNRGAETRIHYTPSTRFYVNDRAGGMDWVTRLPFPVQCVERVEVHDQISNTRLVTRYAYHHGYYDGYEREFRGFAMVEQWDTEEFDTKDATSAWHTPPAHLKSWYHTGDFRDSGMSALMHEFFSTDSSEEGGSLLEPSELPQIPDPSIRRESYRGLKGSLLRQELYADDGSARAAIPYDVTEHSYTVQLLQPQDTHGHAVFAIFPRESIRIHFEREPTDPRVQHEKYLEIDRFGHVLKHLAIAYGRAESTLQAEEAELQTRTLVVYSENAYTNMIDGSDDYLLPQECETLSFEISGFPFKGSMAGGFKLSIADTTEIMNMPAVAYETPVSDSKSKRLLRKSRVYFRSNNLAKPLGLGVIESMAIIAQSHTLTFTPGLLNVYHRQSENLLPEPNKTLNDGGYVDLDSDGCWWAQTSTSFFNKDATTAEQEVAEAKSSFFLPRRVVDPFGNTTSVDYDTYHLLAVRTVDAANNVWECQNNYRVMQPDVVIDPNGNRTAMKFDELGLVVATAVMGKEHESIGDSLEGLALETSEQIRAFLLDPSGPEAVALLGNATQRTIFNPCRFWLEADVGKRKPAFQATIARETHVSDLIPGEKTTIRVGFSYFDGFGRVVQDKVMSNAGEDMKPVWNTSGWTVFNNKGMPVRQYEPFFDSTCEYVSGTSAGVSSILIYDPIGRLTSTISPDHSWNKTVIGPWHSQLYDQNDTVLHNPKEDADIGPLVALVPETECLPTWYEQREGGDLGPLAQKAAAKAAMHADTPSIAHLDAMGRVFLSVADAGNGVRYHTVTELDIQGHVRRTRDAKSRIVMRTDYDMAGSPIHQESMESGEKWVLSDTFGATQLSWDSRKHRFQNVYDALRRRTSTILQTDSRDELTTEKIFYGESLSDVESPAENARGHIVKICDQSGVLSIGQYDFKGRPHRTERQLAQEYKSILDWSQHVGLEEEVYKITSSFDALNRLTRQAMPDDTVILYHFTNGGQLRKVQARVKGEDQSIPFVKDVEYNARGQIQKVEYGNGAISTYTHDPLTFLVTDAVTRRPESSFPGDQANVPNQGWPGTCLQNLQYTYDAVKNAIAITDTSQQAIFYRGVRVDPSTEYTYDATYRLIQATGREHLGTTSRPGRAGAWTPSQQPGDGKTMSRYLESYAYDEVGNLLSMRHRGSNEQQYWTRNYLYQASSLLEPDKACNRLSQTSVGAVTESYSYDQHGNTTSMPALPMMKWDHKDQLRASARRPETGGASASETTWYVYDCSGNRVRKVTERMADGGEITKVKERLYVGVEIFRRFNGRGQVTLERETLAVPGVAGNVAARVEKRTKGLDSGPQNLTRYQLSAHHSIALELDDQARVLTYQEYSPYGATTYVAQHPNIEAPKRFGYGGKERDSENGLYYFGARYYAPSLGRWTSCDPAGLNDGVNVYVYVANDPVNHVDPDGRMFRVFSSGHSTTPISPKSGNHGPNPGGSIRQGSSSRNKVVTPVRTHNPNTWSHIFITTGFPVWSALNIAYNSTGRRIPPWLHNALTRVNGGYDSRVIELLSSEKALEHARAGRVKELRAFLVEGVHAIEIESWARMGNDSDFLGESLEKTYPIVGPDDPYPGTPGKAEKFYFERGQEQIRHEKLEYGNPLPQGPGSQAGRWTNIAVDLVRETVKGIKQHGGPVDSSPDGQQNASVLLADLQIQIMEGISFTLWSMKSPEDRNPRLAGNVQGYLPGHTIPRSEYLAAMKQRDPREVMADMERIKRSVGFM
ncbi:SpvB-domain-containing protein [Madurella fahalii]|uniref:SpvB-domain-containing protein n=1 Tax=Madurella fahalii TaxID=1157608 RepID=A0ABQ0GH07_9PEZI